MIYSQDKHFKSLSKSYSMVGSKTWAYNDFTEKSLISSKNLFTTRSMKIGRPRPKKLEVRALLSGLPFNKTLCDKLVDIKKNIRYHL